MGVDPFLIAPTLIAVIGQRLVRRLCKGGGKPFPIKDSIRLLIEKEFADLPEAFHKDIPALKEFYRAVPTDDCPLGIRGRIAVFELLRMNKKLEQVILKDPVEERVYAAAREDGMFTLREDAIIRALAGEIPFEEINTLGGDLFKEDEY
jgi:type IV pilus assembly protein PilB